MNQSSTLLGKAAVALALLFPSFTSAAQAAEPIIPPFSTDFSDRQNGLDLFTVIDANNDGNTWLIDSDLHARVEFNAAKAMDDWMITPPLHLEAGRRYPLSFTTACSLPSLPERLEVMIGTAPDIEAMQTHLMLPADIADRSFRTVNIDVIVPATGTYYIGFHGCSDPDCASLLVDDLSIAQGISDSTPAAATGLTAVADPSGALSAEITFTAPDATVTGAPLSDLSLITLLRDGQEITRFENPEPGASLSFTDNTPSEGEHTYTVLPHNDSGTGTPAQASTFVGVNIPGKPLAVAIAEPSPGVVRLSWQAPGSDRLGYPLNTTLLTYSVYSPMGIPIIENTSELSAEFRAIAEDSGQLQAVYFVTASSAAGADPYYAGARTPSLIVGSPTHLPFHESFSGMTASATWHLQMPENSEGRWELTAVDPGPHDADGGYAEFTPVIEGDGFSLLSEKIILDVDLPLLSFFYYAVPADDHLNLSVIPLDGSQPILASFPLSSGSGWTEADIDLRPLAGKTVQILFSYSTAAGAHVLFDNISVTSGLLRNLTAISISAPEKMEVGTPYPVEVTVRNAGMEPVDSYNVHLYRDADLVATVTAPSIQPFATAAVTFTQTPTLFFPDQTAYHAVIEADNEQDTSDNTISPVISAISFPACPAVSDLEASADGDAGVTLSWTPVNPADVQPVTLTEDFESYESFTISDLSPWTLVDRDARGTWGIGIDNMPHAGDPMAYILIDNTNFSDDPNFSSRLSGHKYLASICSTAEHNDDWLISPLLSGEPQEISLWARRRGSSASYSHESFEILYSTSGTEPDDFTLLEAFDGVPYQWTLYSAQLPEQARHFAVRCTSPDQFALFIDDITYTPANIYADYIVLGYNIYRNGTLLTPEPVAEPGFTDPDPGQNPTYHVTVLYAQGESRLSNGASPILSAIRLPAAPSSDSAASAPVEYYDLSGRRVLHPASGIYIRRCGTSVTRIALP